MLTLLGGALAFVGTGLYEPKTSRPAFYACFAGWSLFKIYSFAKWQKRVADLAPGPAPSLLTGNITDMIESGGFTEALFVKLHAVYGKIARFFIFPNMLNYSFSDVEEISEVSKVCQERPHETYLFLWFLGPGNLMFLHEPRMIKLLRQRFATMTQRREVLEAAHAMAQKTFGEAAEKTLAGQKGFDFKTASSRLVYEVSCCTLLNLPQVLGTPRGEEMYKCHRDLLVGVNRWLLWPSPGPLFYPPYLKYLATMRRWHAIVGEMIDERAEAYKQDPALEQRDSGGLHMVITSWDEESNRPFFHDRKFAVTNLCLLMNASFDVMISTLIWCVYHLGKHPEEQEKIVEEYKRLKVSATPTLEELKRCVQAEAFIMESLRMKSTVPVNQRVNTNEDVVVKGHLIPKGVNVNQPVCVSFTSEEYFGAKPEEFRPERFVGDSEAAMKAKRSLIAFGVHSRACVGEVIAYVELRTILHALLSRVRVELSDPDAPVKAMIEGGVIVPEETIKFNFTARA